MAYKYVPFTSWVTGFISGNKHKEQGLPDSIVWSVLGTSSVMVMMQVMGGASKVPVTYASAKALCIATFVVTPFYMGATYFLGNQLGKAVRYVEDLDGSEFSSLRYKIRQ